MLIAKRIRKTAVKANPHRRKRNIAAPRKRATAAKKAFGAKRRKTRNPGAGVLAILGPINPHRKGAPKVARKKKTTPRRRRKNPFTAAAHKHHRRIRRNPNRSSIGNIFTKPVELLKMGAVAALGFIATRQVPQMVLGDRNTGAVGYGANALVALTTGGVAGKVLGPQAGGFATVGGGLYLVSRLINEYTPLGKTLALSGVGDPQAAGHLGRLGSMIQAYFPVPVVSRKDGSAVLPALLNPPPPTIQQPAAATVGRFGSRF